MFPAKFAYAAPSSLQEAVGLLADPEAKVLAGGHSLLPLMKLRLAQPKLLVDIGRIPGLSYVRSEDGQLAIGAMTTYREIELSDVVHRAAPVLAEAAHEVGDPQVRAKGTLAGALAHADPAGDLPAVVLALGGSVRAVGPSGERDIDLDGFFVDMLTTALDEREIIREVRLRAQQPGAGAAYQKFDQPASHYALTGICVVVTLNGGSIASARIGVTGVGPKAYRPTAVEQALIGKPAEEEAVKAAVQTVADGIDVQGDIHASPEYRAHLARVLTRRAVLQAAQRARG
ncbi:MAG: xanthine dehydrogenase family protein subunit M [Chloroflexi bacterium]|nr:MAG: xanthine dehydrogenase family protein subunit M [Chloroflexota bacterium]TMF00227.1 MAG: xanthine dehydrogenase family protein subunit M [Chloroflexota bacterium]